jgi:hypothetical protein
MIKDAELTQELVREFLDYDPDTGVLTWKRRDREWFASDQSWERWNTGRAGKPAGTVRREPRRDNLYYIQIGILGTTYLAHRVIWLWQTGSWPTAHIDHINHDGSDNCWKNLREATPQLNRRNLPLSRTSKSGHIGVHLHKRTGRYRAIVGVDKRQIHLGYFRTPEQAAAARKAAEQQHGFSPGHGSPRVRAGGCVG